MRTVEQVKLFAFLAELSRRGHWIVFAFIRRLTMFFMFRRDNPRVGFSEPRRNHLDHRTGSEREKGQWVMSTRSHIGDIFFCRRPDERRQSNVIFGRTITPWKLLRRLIIRAKKQIQRRLSPRNYDIFLISRASKDISAGDTRKEL